MKKNITLIDWLDKIIGYRNNSGQLFLHVNDTQTPKILTGDFEKPILDSRESFLRDSYILERRSIIETTFRRGDNPEEVNISLKVTRQLANSSKEVFIYGFFACVDEKILEGSIQLKKCFVDNTNVLKNVEYFPLPKATSSSYEPTGSYGMFIPFKIPLIYPDERKIEYELEFKASIQDVDSATAVYNVRTKKEIEVAEMTAYWDSELFNQYFKECISFKGESNEVSKLFGTLKSGGNFKNCSAYRKHIPHELDNNLYKFSCKAFNIKPYHMAGFTMVKI